MKVPLPLLFLLLMTLVIIAVYDILSKSYSVHNEANRRVAQAVLESTLTLANTGLNNIAARVAAAERPLEGGTPKIAFPEDIERAEEYAHNGLFLGFDRNHRIIKGRVGQEALGPEALQKLASQPAFTHLFRRQSGVQHLSDAILIAVEDTPFMLSAPQPLRNAGRSDGPRSLVVGLPARAIIFDKLQRYEVFGRGALKAYLERKNDLSSLRDLILSLQNREYTQFHFSAVAQIVVLLIAFVIAVMIGHHVDEKNDALRKSRDIIAEREREAQNLRQLAETANEAKSQFIHNMSHELRTPLNAILGYADVITNEMFGALDGPLGRYKESADAIRSGGQRLLDSISQVLEYSSLVDADHDVREEHIDIAALLSDLASEFRDQVKARRIALEVRETPQLPRLRADREMMRSLFKELISNAIAFSEDGGSVTVRPELSPDGRLRVVVSDHGRGMDPDLQGQAFEAFVQGEDVFARQHHGMGLGLSLAKAYAHFHGAAIEIESTPGQGTTAAVLFSAERLVRVDREREGEDPISGTAPDIHGPVLA